MAEFEQWPAALRARNFRLPRWEQLPTISLYMDQLIGYVNEIYAPLDDPNSEDLMLTKSMVNNYVKQRVVPPPDRKRYGRAQLARLLVLCPLKQVFSIPECVGFLSIALESELGPRAYDRFCEQLEGALGQAFGGKPVPDRAEDRYMQRLAAVYAGKVRLQKELLYRESLREGAEEKAARAKK